MARAIQKRAGALDILCSGSCKDFRRARDAVLHHAPCIVADLVVYSRGRNAMAVLQHWIQGDAVVRFRQILASDTDHQTTINQRAIDSMMVSAPWKAACNHAGNGFIDGPGPTGELQRIAADEVS